MSCLITLDNGGVITLAACPALAIVITGAPAWLKPTKFAVSTAIYAFTLAWLFTWIPDWTRTRRLVGIGTAVVMLVEVGIIDLQAWRGTTSHFNVGTPLDAILFSIMGAAIFSQTAASGLVAYAFWRARFADRAMGWALRLGMTLTIAGALTGALMTRPTAAQMDQVRTTHQMPVVGAHTVGAPDGGPGLPGVGWSTVAGDLRVPHFVGLHAMQVLPLFAWIIRRRPDATRVRLLLAGSAAYAVVFGGLLLLALRGVPLTALVS